MPWLGPRVGNCRIMLTVASFRALEEHQNSGEQRKQSMVERMSEIRYLQGKTAEAQATMQKLKVR